MKFYGVKGGKEKEAIIKGASVGVANPTALSETFCVSAVEFEMLGIPVVAKAKNSFFDVIHNFKSGFLFKTKLGLVFYTVLLLKMDKLNRTMGKNGYKFVSKKFDNKNISTEWNNLLFDINEGRKIKTKHSSKLNVVIHNAIWINIIKSRLSR